MPENLNVPRIKPGSAASHLGLSSLTSFTILTGGRAGKAGCQLENFELEAIKDRSNNYIFCSFLFYRCCAIKKPTRQRKRRRLATRLWREQTLPSFKLGKKISRWRNVLNWSGMMFAHVSERLPQSPPGPVELLWHREQERLHLPPQQLRPPGIFRCKPSSCYGEFTCWGSIDLDENVSLVYNNNKTLFMRSKLALGHSNLNAKCFDPQSRILSFSGLLEKKLLFLLLLNFS